MHPIKTLSISFVRVHVSAPSVAIGLVVVVLVVVVKHDAECIKQNSWTASSDLHYRLGLKIFCDISYILRAVMFV